MTMNTKTLGTMSLMLTAAALAGTTLSVRADDNTATAATSADTNAAPAIAAAPQSDGWRFGATIPAWIVGIDGNVTLLGHQQDVNVDFNTLRDHLDQSFSLGVSAGKGRFGLYGDVGYMRFSGGFNGPLGGNTSADLKFLISDAGLSYVLCKTGEEHPFVLAGNVGIRYWYTATDLTFRGPMGNIILSGGNNRNVEDPVIGLSASQYVTRKLHLDVSGDVGGFDINNDMDWTWSATAMASYDFCRWFTLSAGYKALALDESNSGAHGKNGVNLIFNGALIAAQFKF